MVQGQVNQTTGIKTPEYPGYSGNCSEKGTKALWQHTYIQERKQSVDDA